MSLKNVLNNVNDVVGSIGNVGSAVGSIAGLFSNGMSHHDERVAKRLYSYQNDENLKYLVRQLEDYTKPYYEWTKLNDPKLTVQGFQDAGINPLIAFGGASVPSSGDTLQPHNVPDSISGLLNSSAASRSTNASNLLALAEAGKAVAETSKVKQDTKSVVTFNKFAHDLYKGNAQTALGNSLLVGSQIKLNFDNSKLIYKQMTNFDAQTQNLNAITKNLGEQFNLLVQQGKMNDKQIELWSTQCALNMIKTLRENYGLEHVDPATVTHLKSSAYLAAQQGNALTPAILLGNLLMSDKDSRNSYLTGQINSVSGAGLVSFYQGENQQLNFNIKSGNFVGVAKQIFKNGAKETDNPKLKPLFGSIAVGSAIVTSLINGFSTPFDLQGSRDKLASSAAAAAAAGLTH